MGKEWPKHPKTCSFHDTYWSALPSAPKNNDGRNECWQCKQPTRIAGMIYNVCSNQDCSWFER